MKNGVGHRFSYSASVDIQVGDDAEVLTTTRSFEAEQGDSGPGGEQYVAVSLAEDGTYAVDIRLRDILRGLGFGAADTPPVVEQDRPHATVDEAALFAAEHTTLFEADLGAFFGARIDDLEARLGRLERGPAAGVRRLAGSLRS